RRGQAMKNNNNWRGGRVLGRAKTKGKYLDKGAGYWYLRIKNHPNAKKSGYVAEHVVVATKAIKRPLRKGEIVHHLNMIKDDNQKGNLVICNNKNHANWHRQLEELGAIAYSAGLVKFSKKKGYVPTDAFHRLVCRNRRIQDRSH
ncbi:hypothetical protein KAR91_71830, partial [Candidatus Pacearchaeota archaeon]|nr:hypothetical protein [Candidatus Pacearchaeota archaeon]